MVRCRGSTTGHRHRRRHHSIQPPGQSGYHGRRPQISVSGKYPTHAINPCWNSGVSGASSPISVDEYTASLLDPFCIKREMLCARWLLGQLRGERHRRSPSAFQARVLSLAHLCFCDKSDIFSHRRKSITITLVLPLLRGMV